MAGNSRGWILGPPIGHGATATVNLAADAISGDLFAVKSSHISKSAPLQKEESILSSISSPHIISCLGSSVSNNCFNLFLEYAAGGSLSDHAGYLSEPKIRSFTRQIVLALRYLHSIGIAHCDVKGRNVLVCSEGKIKLADFGCARRAGERFVMGTPAFMAPEVARGEEQGISGDVWSLGCTVVEMATGKSPWPDVDGAIAAIHRIGYTNDVPAMPESFSQEAKDFVLKCFRRDPKERWTADQLLSHPFVAEAEEEEIYSVLPCFGSKQGTWVSPKTTLDFGLWEMGIDENWEEEVFDLMDESEMGIRQLDLQPANWSWDDDWIEVRGSNDEKNTAMSPEVECSSLISGDGCECSGRDVSFDFHRYGLNYRAEELGSLSSVFQSEAGDEAEHLVSSCSFLNWDCNEEFLSLFC